MNIPTMALHRPLRIQDRDMARSLSLIKAKGMRVLNELITKPVANPRADPDTGSHAPFYPFTLAQRAQECLSPVPA